MMTKQIALIADLSRDGVLDDQEARDTLGRFLDDPQVQDAMKYFGIALHPRDNAPHDKPARAAGEG